MSGGVCVLEDLIHQQVEQGWAQGGALGGSELEIAGF